MLSLALLYGQRLWERWEHARCAHLGACALQEHAHGPPEYQKRVIGLLLEHLRADGLQLLGVALAGVEPDEGKHLRRAGAQPVPPVLHRPAGLWWLQLYGNATRVRTLSDILLASQHTGVGCTPDYAVCHGRGFMGAGLSVLLFFCWHSCSATLSVEAVMECLVHTRTVGCG